MKRLLAMLFSVILVVSCTVVPAIAIEADDAVGAESVVIQRRDFINLTHTETVARGTKTVDLTINYSAREDLSTSSGFRIASIDRCRVSNVQGWIGHNGAVIDQSGITYTNSHQTADVPVTYTVSEGNGWESYTVHITLDLRG